MSVSLSPSSSLGFPRPLTRLVQRDLSITNHNAQPVAFKVKTTAPKLYCVRPNSGRVEPGETHVVSVMLQALKDEPPLGAKCKDKFLIQSTIISSDKNHLSLTDLWASPETASQVSQQKLRVIYQAAEGQTLEEEDESQVNMSSIITNDNRYDTVRQAPNNINGHDQAIQHRSFSPDYAAATEEHPVEEQPDAPAITVDAPREPERHEQPALNTIHPIAPNQPLPAAPSPEMQRQLADATAEIQRLRTLLATAPSSAAPQELRRRTKALSDDGSVAESDVGTVLEEAVHPEGVPLQVVVIIALGVFITTYLFF